MLKRLKGFYRGVFPEKTEAERFESAIRQAFWWSTKKDREKLIDLIDHSTLPSYQKSFHRSEVLELSAVRDTNENDFSKIIMGYHNVLHDPKAPIEMKAESQYRIGGAYLGQAMRQDLRILDSGRPFPPNFLQKWVPVVDASYQLASDQLLESKKMFENMQSPVPKSLEKNIDQAYYGKIRLSRLV